MSSLTKSRAVFHMKCYILLLAQTPWLLSFFGVNVLSIVYSYIANNLQLNQGAILVPAIILLEKCPFSSKCIVN